MEKYCYNDLESSCDVYGGLYQWDEMMQYVTTPGAKGICPQNWHVPDSVDFKLFSNALGGDGVSGGKVKEEGLAHWYPPNYGATNESGFTALPGGGCSATNGFSGITKSGYFFTSKQEMKYPTYAYYRSLSYMVETMYTTTVIKTTAFAVRCLKN